MSLRIESVFGLACAVGAATVGLRKFGVPPGGPFDKESASIANAILGNHPDAPILEIALGRFEATAQQDIDVAIVGAECPASVSGRAVAMQSAVKLSAGESLLLAPPALGARVYLALPGGVSAPVGVRLCAGSSISGCEIRIPRGGVLLRRPDSLGSAELRVVPGPQAELLPADLLEREFRLSPSSDRVGARLLPRVAQHGIEMPSEPACPGVIQATPSGELIVLGPDGPTIGGYPKVAVVCSADLDLLAQIPLGGAVRFAPTSLGRAREALRENRRRLEACLSSLRQASRAM